MALCYMVKLAFATLRYCIKYLHINIGWFWRRACVFSYCIVARCCGDKKAPPTTTMTPTIRINRPRNAMLTRRERERARVRKSQSSFKWVGCFVGGVFCGWL